MKIYQKRIRLANGKLTGWYIIDRLPEHWPMESMVNIYLPSGNRLYNVPDDSARYYEILHGAICHNCGSVIDKSCELHAEAVADSEMNLCKKCWSAINHGELDLPQVIDDRPLYRLRNNPVRR